MNLQQAAGELTFLSITQIPQKRETFSFRDACSADAPLRGTPEVSTAPVGADYISAQGHPRFPQALRKPQPGTGAYGLPDRIPQQRKLRGLCRRLRPGGGRYLLRRLLLRRHDLFRQPFLRRYPLGGLPRQQLHLPPGYAAGSFGRKRGRAAGGCSPSLESRCPRARHFPRRIRTFSNLRRTFSPWAM